ncbi:glucose-dependent insulinotropic receptor [Polypterus senegalus]|uniref:glucose-dependent insulinotropic receptor n=1 Tax=Polypterus senegalus TaxID=55291 RepID=UPI001962555A|nr:glucose-dependent insulinotropic receptor [Polypterus senegalus]
MNYKVFGWILTVSSVLIVTTNLLIASALLLLIRRKKNKSWYFVFNLAVADILVGFAIIGIVKEVFNSNTLQTQKTTCLIRMAWVTSSSTASILAMFLIAFDRYLAIKQPFRYLQIMTAIVVAACICGQWLLSFLIGFLPVMVKELQTSTYNDVCTFFSVVRPKAMILVFSVGFFPVLCVFIYFYCDILKIAYSHQRQIREAQPAGSLPQQPGYFHRDMKALRTVTIQVGCFTLSWAPFFVVCAIQACCETCYLYQVIENYLWLLGLSNSLLNPLVYACWQRDVREQVWLLFIHMKTIVVSATVWKNRARGVNIAHVHHNQIEATAPAM